MVLNKLGFKAIVLLSFIMFSASVAAVDHGHYSDIKLDEDTGVSEIFYIFEKEQLPSDQQLEFDAFADIDPATNKPKQELDYSLENFSDDRLKPFIAINENGIMHSITKNKEAFDYEALYTGDPENPGNVFTLDIVVQNLETNKTFKINSKITIVDRNEPPSITEAGPFNVQEIPVSRSIGFIKAVDPDSCSAIKPCTEGGNPKGFNKLEYYINEILEVDGSSDFPFDLDFVTGEITLKEGKTLDYKKQNKYAFIVKVLDKSSDLNNPRQLATQEVTINVIKNRPPTFKTVSNIYEVKENTAVGAKFGDAIVVHDEDSADSSVATDNLTFSIRDANGAREGALSANDFFEVVRVSNTDSDHQTQYQLAVKKKLNYEELYDSEKKEVSFSVIFSVTDQKGNKIEKSAKIKVLDVNEEPSFNNNSYTFTIKEYTGKSNLVGIVSAKDPDIFNGNYGSLYYSLDDTTNKNDDASQFKIDSKTGEIHSIDKAKFSEDNKTFTFNAVVTDKGFTKKVPVAIFVTEFPQTPVLTQPPKFAVDENTPKGTKVGKIEVERSCSESNSKNCAVPKFSLTAADEAANDYKAFNIDNNGVITVAKDNVLDYETQNKYVIRVVATNSEYDWLYSSIDATIHVVDDPNDQPTSSSSAKSTSSSSVQNNKSSSSVAKSSSSQAKSSSSKKVESSSSKAKSSSSKKSDAIASPAKVKNNGTSFYVRMASTVEFDIVLSESSPSHVQKYAIMDMKGQVLSMGNLNNKETRVQIPTPGSYIVKIGIDYKLIKIR